MKIFLMKSPRKYMRCLEWIKRTVLGDGQSGRVVDRRQERFPLKHFYTILICYIFERAKERRESDFE